MNKLKLAIMAAGLAGVMSASASLTTTFDINYSDGSGDVGSGILQATPNGDGSYTAISGSFQWSTVNAKFFHNTSGLVSDLFTLIPNPNAPSSVVQSYGTGENLQIDDQLFPSQSIFLDLNGLMFGSANSVFNVYNNGTVTTYGVYVDGPHGSGQYDAYENDNGSFTLSAVPEPTTVVAGAMLLLPFGFSTLRMFRKTRTA